MQKKKLFAYFLREGQGAGPEVRRACRAWHRRHGHPGPAQDRGGEVHGAGQGRRVHWEDTEGQHEGRGDIPGKKSTEMCRKKAVVVPKIFEYLRNPTCLRKKIPFRSANIFQSKMLWEISENFPVRYLWKKSTLDDSFLSQWRNF